MSKSSYRLGFDGGGTKTRAVVIDEARAILGSGESGSSNPYAVGLGAALDNIESAADAALAQAQLTRDDVGGWGLGLGGVCSPKESKEVEAALRARLGPGPSIVAVEDVVSTWAGAFGAEESEVPRAICIAGTGVGCWGRNAAGEVAQADGAGPLLGDRGSGYWIGEAALRHTTRALDGVAPHDDLSRAVMEHLGAPDIKALIRIVYAPDFERARVAELVRVVLAHQAERNADTILQGAGQELAGTSLAVLRKLCAGELRGEIALIGGVLAHAAPVRAAFVERLERDGTRIAFVEARYEPAVGAALLV